MSKKFILPCLLFASFSFITFFLKAQTKQSNIVVDGLEEDWKASIFNVDSVSGFEYSIAKSEDRLFLIIRFTDKLNQIKALTNGMQIGFDMYEKNKSQQYINFPLDNSSKLNPVETLRDLNMMQYSLLLVTTQYELRKFMNGNGVYKYDTENPNGIKLAFTVNKSDQLVIEYGIPFETLRNKKDAPGLTSTTIDLEVFIPSLRINSPSSTSTGMETGSFNSKFSSNPTAIQNRTTSHASSSNPIDGLKEQYKNLFESTKKKIRVAL